MGQKPREMVFEVTFGEGRGVRIGKMATKCPRDRGVLFNCSDQIYQPLIVSWQGVMCKQGDKFTAGTADCQISCPAMTKALRRNRNDFNPGLRLSVFHRAILGAAIDYNDFEWPRRFLGQSLVQHPDKNFARILGGDNN